jgi:hypothetical protein
MDETNRHADELAAVRDLLSMPSPSPEAVDSGRARLLSELLAVPTEGLQRDLPAQGLQGDRSAWRGRRWWAPVRNGLVGAAVAAALALAVAVPTDSLIRLTPDPAPTGPSARQILLAAASATAKAPSDGAYWRTSVVTGQLVLSPDRRYVIKRESARETWLTRRYGDRWSGRYLGARPATPEDEAAWRAAGSPSAWRFPDQLIEAAPGRQRSGPHRVGWRNADGILTKQLVGWTALRTVPSDPTALRAFLVAHIAQEKGAFVGRQMEAELRETCLELITALPVPPDVRASAYQILASMPGMKPEGAVADPLGRTGQALSYQYGTSDERLVIDPASGLPLAVETSSVTKAADGRDVEVGHFTAYQQIGWTDERPAK